ncbi:MAG TPA: 3-hydroxyacyl-ACP dehydratase FabZ [Terracidiphilus sp.]|jgi:3-hydroxyacyl-[acyl-carrier-protein] dehydratase|nr:3-hydroxyacyl-ACP dehydratase FabZ [Terracidiphilus sp.]
MIERNEIEKIIPHRPPFLWIDRVEELQPGIRCVAWLSVGAENPILAGHFPARPILPGVLIIEAVAQTAAVMMGSASPAEATGTALLAAVNRFKFFKPVAPGMLLRIETTKLTQAGTMVCIEGTVSALGEKVASGELSVVSGR